VASNITNSPGQGDSGRYRPLKIIYREQAEPSPREKITNIIISPRIDDAELNRNGPSYRQSDTISSQKLVDYLLGPEYKKCWFSTAHGPWAKASQLYKRFGEERG